MIHRLMRQIGEIFTRMYTGNNLLWQIAAVVLTYVLVVSGFDAWWFSVTRGAGVQGVTWPAVIVGGLIPYALPLVLFLFGFLAKKKKLMMLAVAIILAALLGLGISSAYKVFTGRIPPGFRTASTLSLPDIVARSHGFRLGFYRGGAFNGWPSSHTTVSFAIALTIIAFYPRKKWLRYLVLAYALYVGLGVSTNIHWFSDFAAGIIFGSIIGGSVGKSLISSRDDFLE